MSIGFVALSALASGGVVLLVRRVPRVAAAVVVGLAVVAALPRGVEVARQTRTFAASGQRELGPAGYEVLPRPFVEAAQAHTGASEPWALRSAAIEASRDDPDTIGLLIAVHAIHGEPYLSDADRRDPSSALRSASARPCGDIRVLGWLAFLMAPRPLDCANPRIVLFWQVAPGPGDRIVASGEGWAVVRR